MAWHDDKASGFAQNAPDDEWMAVVGKRGWIVLTHDKRFHKSEATLAAVRQHSVRCLYLDGGALGTWDKFVLFARCASRVTTIIAKENPPYIYRLHNSGRITPVRKVKSGEN